jgi:hypothetical protein
VSPTVYGNASYFLMHIKVFSKNTEKFLFEISFRTKLRMARFDASKSGRKLNQMNSKAMRDKTAEII